MVLTSRDYELLLRETVLRLPILLALVRWKLEHARWCYRKGYLRGGVDITDIS